MKFAGFAFITLFSHFCLKVSAMDGCNITDTRDGDKTWGRRFWKCGDQCLLDEVTISSNLTASSTCLSCLAASTPASCQSCQTEGTCLNSKMIGQCRNCVFNIYFGMARCASRMKPAEITNCIAANVHSHCKVCVCWAVCRFGMKSVCNCCRNNQC